MPIVTHLIKEAVSRLVREIYHPDVISAYRISDFKGRHDPQWDVQMEVRTLPGEWHSAPVCFDGERS